MNVLIYESKTWILHSSNAMGAAFNQTNVKKIKFAHKHFLICISDIFSEYKNFLWQIEPTIFKSIDDSIFTLLIIIIPQPSAGIPEYCSLLSLRPPFSISRFLYLMSQFWPVHIASLPFVSLGFLLGLLVFWSTYYHLNILYGGLIFIWLVQSLLWYLSFWFSLLLSPTLLFSLLFGWPSIYLKIL